MIETNAASQLLLSPPLYRPIEGLNFPETNTIKMRLATLPYFPKKHRLKTSEQAEVLGVGVIEAE